MKKIIIYSTPTCHYCKDAKEYFDSRKIKYEIIDVSQNLEKRKQMIEESEQMGVPVIKIGTKILVGFNKDKVEEALK
jgi:glutaredoxin 3